MTSTFIPSTLPHLIYNEVTGKPQSKGIKCRWWGDNSFYTQPGLLISAYWLVDEPRHFFDFKKNYAVPNSNFLFVADSGGYQSYSKGLWIDPIKILKWMEFNEVSVGMGLDVPPAREDSITLNKTFDDHLAKSINHYEIAIRHRSSDKWNLYLPIQGYRYGTFQHWYKKIKDIPCDGYASTPRDYTSPLMTAFITGFAISEGIQNFHHFHGTGFNILPVLAYAGNFIKQLTFDSASMSYVATRFRDFFIPIYHEKVHAGDRWDYTLEEIPCICPVCSVHTFADYNNTGTIPGVLIQIHNIWVIRQEFETLKALAKDKKFFREIVSKNYPRETLQALDFIDMAVDGQYYEACLKYGMVHSEIYDAGSQFV